jgi:hypothetical protein
MPPVYSRKGSEINLYSGENMLQETVVKVYKSYPRLHATTHKAYATSTHKSVTAIISQKHNAKKCVSLSFKGHIFANMVTENEIAHTYLLNQAAVVLGKYLELFLDCDKP